MRMTVKCSLLLFLVLTVVGLRPGVSIACSIDGVPTLTVNGYSVVINKVVPTAGPSLRVWAPFVLSFALHTQHNEVLEELPQRVPLLAEAKKSPWRWNFGDGTPTVRGIRVQHSFRKPGIYKITVEAYYPSHKFWYTFDAVQVHVLRG